MIGEWYVPFRLTSPGVGTLALSGETGYMFDDEGCDAGADLRVVRNHIPAGRGSILGSVKPEGYAMRLRMRLMETTERAACNEVLREMLDALGIHLWALEDPDSGGRIEWDPSGDDTRMLDQIKIIERGKVTWQNQIAIVSFAVGTRYPYAMDAAEIVTSIGAGGSAVLTYGGTAEFYPVFKVYSVGSWTLTNATTGYSIVYNSGLPGAPGSGSYIEIDTFRNTAYVDGDGANAKPGIDWEETDFWSLFPGGNSVTISGASVDVLWQSAYE